MCYKKAQTDYALLVPPSLNMATITSSTDRLEPFSISTHAYKTVDGHDILLDLLLPKKLVSEGLGSESWSAKSGGVRGTLTWGRSSASRAHWSADPVPGRLRFLLLDYSFRPNRRLELI